MPTTQTIRLPYASTCDADLLGALLARFTREGIAFDVRVVGEFATVTVTGY